MIIASWHFLLRFVKNDITYIWQKWSQSYMHSIWETRWISLSYCVRYIAHGPEASNAINILLYIRYQLSMNHNRFILTDKNVQITLTFLEIYPHVCRCEYVRVICVDVNVYELYVYECMCVYLSVYECMCVSIDIRQLRLHWSPNINISIYLNVPVWCVTWM